MASDRSRMFSVQSSVGVGCFDIAGRLLEANHACCELLGYSTTELATTRLQDWVHPADAAAVTQAWQQVVTGQTHTVQLRHRVRHPREPSLWIATRLIRSRSPCCQHQVSIVATFEEIPPCQPLEAHLRRRIARECRLAEFSQRTLKSFDLDDSLPQAVQAIREHLQADRVFIYRLPGQSATTSMVAESVAESLEGGQIVAESVGKAWSSGADCPLSDPAVARVRCSRFHPLDQPLKLSDVSTAHRDRGESAWHSQCHSCSNVTIPILQETDLYGLLTVQQRHEPRPWQTDEIDWVQQFATQIAIAIRQSDLYAQARQQAFQQQAISDLSRALLSGNSLDTFFDLALRKVADIFAVDRVVIGQYQRDRDRWLLIAEENRQVALPDILGEELSPLAVNPWAPTEPTAFHLPDLRDVFSSRHCHPVLQGAWVICPLWLDGALWGGLMIAVPSAETVQRVTLHLGLVDLMGRQLALAIQQSVFCRQWQTQVEQQTGLHRLHHVIRDSLHQADIFRRVIPEIRYLLKVERVLIWEFDPNRRTWILRSDHHCGDYDHSFAGLEIPDTDNSLTHHLKQGKVCSCDQQQFSSEEVIQVLAKTFPGAWLWLPLQFEHMTWGVLHCIQKDPWQPWQRELGLAVADRLAIALQQSLLYEQVQAANQQLQELALLDGLTQIPNRRYFDDYLQQEWLRTCRETTSLSLILCDVDFFKAYNDAHGHQQGDTALKAIAQLLSNVVQRPGDVVARYGGEEFGIVLPRTTSVGAARLATSILDAFAQAAMAHPASPQQQITLSMGICCRSAHNDLEPTELLTHADRALYRAKEQGRNQFCIYPEKGL